MSRRVVVALGGNALLRRGEPLTEAVQQRNAETAAQSLSRIVREEQCAITHGNGPQIGLLALESEAYKDVPAYGLDVLGAESQGMIGFLLQQALRNQLPERIVATLLTSVIVDAADPAFANPTKFVGPVYTEAVAQELVRGRGWQVRQDGAGYRRVVPSPIPTEIIELKAIRTLFELGVLVICSGGGGVPVVRTPDGRLDRVEAVVDKDLTSALLAEALQADVLLLLTDVHNVELDWGTKKARPIHEATPVEMRRHAFAPGSMGPKVDAACRFVERTGCIAVIGALSDADAMLDGDAGTRITPEP